jgi:hypothetical protein
MPQTFRRFGASATALLAAILCGSAAGAMQAAAAPDIPELLRMANDEFLKCGQTAVQAGKAPPPKTLNDAKSILGVNCMTEYNLLIELTAAWAGRRPSIEDVNKTFDFAATLIMAPAGPARATQTQDKSVQPTTVTTVRQAPPESCKGSVKKGLKAYNAGSFDTALCHWLPKARSGDAAAQNNMGLLFERGLTADTPRSDEQAAAWFRLAADRGDTMAMRNLAGAQTRMGRPDEARAWIDLADATDARNRLLRQQQREQALAILAAGLACALGGCAAPAPVYAPPAVSVDYGVRRPAGAAPFRPLDPGLGLGSSRIGSSGVGRRGSSSSSGGTRLCPDGSYVSGTCHMTPDGGYLGGPARMAPDGSYVEQGRVRMSPNGNYLGGNGRMLMCPDGTYVTGTRCVLTPNGKYIGQ